MKYPIKMSLRVKLILAFLFIAIAALGTFAFLSNTRMASILTNQTNQRLHMLASTQAEVISTLIINRITAMKLLAVNDIIAEAADAQNASYRDTTAAILANLSILDDQWKAAADDSSLIRTYLTNPAANECLEFKQNLPDFTEVFLTDRYGGLAAASDRTSNYYHADENWWQAAYNNGHGGIFVDKPELDKDSGIFSINIAIPVYSEEHGAIVGVLRSTLDITALIQSMKSTGNDTTAADLLFPDGSILSHTGDTETLDPEVVNKFASPADTADFMHDGVRILAKAENVTSNTESFVNDLGWRVISHQSRKEAMATLTQSMRYTLVLTIGVIVLSVVTALIMSRQLTRPIAKLSEVTARITEGDLSARAPIVSKDEIGDLAARFNQMVGQVNSLILDTNFKSQELAGRTAQLEANQRALQVVFSASSTVQSSELLSLVVNLIRDRFNLYHVQMYLVDPERQAAVLSQSTGYAGQQLLLKHHSIPLEKQSLVTKTVRDGKPVLVDDVSQDPDFLPNPLLPDTRSELSIPLKIGDEVIGVLDAQSRDLDYFNPDRVELFETIVNQVALLFRNSELFTKLAEQSESLRLYTSQLSTASEVARRVSSILDLDQLLSEVVELMQSRFGLYHVHIYLLDKTSDTLTVKAGSGEVGKILKERGHGIPLDREKSLVARSARDRKTIVVNDTALQSDFMPNPLLPQTRSELSVPLMIGDQVLGILDVQDDQVNRFTQSDMDVFNTLAGQVASALQNAHLFEAQKQAEAAVRQSEERLRSVFDNMQDVVYRTDLQSRLIWVTPSASEMFGYPKEENLIGRNVLDEAYVHPEERQNILKELTKKGRISDYELEMRRADGSIFWGSISACFFNDTEGNIAGIEGTFRNINERKHAEERVRIFQALAENAGDAIIMGGLDGKLSYANRAAYELSGFDYATEKGALLGANMASMAPDAQLPRQIEALQQIMTTGKSWSGEVQARRRDNSVVDVAMTMFPVLGETGQPISIAAIMRDITEHKQAEEQRARFTTQLRTAANVAGQITTVLDVDELLAQVVTLLKESFDLYHVHIYTFDSLIEDLVMRAGYGEPGRVMKESGHRIPLSREQSLVARAARTRQSVIVDDVTQTVDFMPNPLLPETRSEVAVPLMIGEKILGVFDVQHNLPHYFTSADLDVFNTLSGQIASALQNAALFEETQRTAERLREVDRLKSEFLASMSHELRTPLNSIIGYAEVLLMGIDGDMNPETQEDVQAIFDNGQHLLRLINDVLDLAKIEAGRLNLKFEDVNVPDLLEEVKTNNMGLIHKSMKPVEFMTGVGGSFAPLHADPLRLSQILNNLVSNAVKFTEKGCIELSARQENGWTVIEVKDTGIGIEAENLEKIFDKFRQVDGSSKRRAEGTGLGLAITRSLVQMHGGSITVHSKPGEGSAFIVRLPNAGPQE